MILTYLNYIKENLSSDKYNGIIDYTYLKSNTTLDKIKEMCQAAQDNKFYSVCVMPEYVSDAYGFLDDDSVKICTVINFPHGKNKSEQNIKDVNAAISDGADEIDFVVDYDQIKKASVLENILMSKINGKELTDDEVKEEQDLIDSMYDKVQNKLNDVATICHRNSVILKVILETGELTLEQIKKLCLICDQVGVDYVMTSTGTREKGAELSKVAYLRKILPEYVKIKVSGGIRTMQDVEKFYPYADRIGTSTLLKDIQPK